MKHAAALVKYLYGDLPAVQQAISDLVKTTVLPARAGRKSPLSQKDCMVITYGDQVRQPGVPPLRTLGKFFEGRLHGLVSSVHLLPFYPSSSDDGFSVMDYLEVDPALGTWDDIQALAGPFDLMFDAVFNHASVQGAWFQKFLRQEPGWESAFVTVEGTPDLSAVVRPRALPLLTRFQTAAGVRNVWTTFSADQADINFADPRMFIRILEVLLNYVTRGARFIRLDAIAFLWKTVGTPCIHLDQTHAVIQAWRALLDEVAPGARLITETNVAHSDNISYFGNGHDEAHLVYNFALPPLVLHAFLTGSSRKLAAWAQSLELPSEDTSFFNFLASHDGIGLNPARGILTSEEIEALVRAAIRHGGYVSYKNNPDGSRSPYELNINFFDALSDPAGGEPGDLQVARFLSAQAILLAMRGVPGIYFHSLFGSRGDRAGAEASGIPRRINREKSDLATIERELATKGTLREKVFSGMKILLQARASHPAFSPATPQVVLPSPEGLFALARGGVLCLSNLTPVEIEYLPPPGRWCPLAHLPAIKLSQDQIIHLPAYGVAWLAGEDAEKTAGQPDPAGGGTKRKV